MKKIVIAAASVAAAGFFAPAANAATFRTAVSVSGVDTNPCTPAAPCRTISYALTQTSPGGEMYILSSGGYGPFTVTQAVTITAPTGTVAAISAGSGNGITVSAGATDLVILNGFLINGLGTGFQGVQVNSVGSLSVNNTTITGFTGYGINFNPNVGTGAATLNMANGSIYQNTTGTVNMQVTGGTANTTAARANFHGTVFSSNAIVVQGENTTGRTQMLISECTLRYSAGINVTAAPGGVLIQVSKSNVFNTTNAFVANGGGATIAVEGSSLSHINTIATTTGGASIRSYGNNAVQFVTNSGWTGSAIGLQ